MASCHPDRPHLARGLCQRCYTKQPDVRAKRNAASRRYRADRPEHMREVNRRRYAADPEKHRSASRRSYWKYVERHRARHRQWRDENRELVKQIGRQHRQRARTRRYGVTLEALVEAQGGRCGICQTDQPNEQGFTLDHDHATGKARGALCARCNLALGLLGDTVEIVRRALAYLQEPVRPSERPLPLFAAHG